MNLSKHLVEHAAIGALTAPMAAAVVAGSGTAPNTLVSFLNLRRATAIGTFTPPAPYNYATFAEMTAKNQVETAAASVGTGTAKWTALVSKDYALHGGLVFVPGGFGGYMYWFCYTPLPKNSTVIDSLFENACVAASNDLQTWVTPPGGYNPVIAPPVPNAWYNSDPHLYYDAPNKRMVLAYRLKNATNSLMISVTSDGMSWSTPVAVWTAASATNDMASPSVFFDGTQWVCYSHDLSAVPPVFRRMVNGSSDVFSGWPATPTTVTPPVIPAGFDGTTFSWFHSCFKRLDDSRIVGLMQKSTPSEMWLAESVDGLVFYGRRLDMVCPGTTQVMYRPTFAVLPGNDVVAVYSYVEKAIFGISLLRQHPANFKTEEIAKLAAISLLAKYSGTLAAGTLWADSMIRADDAVSLGTADSGGVYTYSGKQFVIVSNRAVLNDTAVSVGRAMTASLGTTDYSVSLCINTLNKTGAATWSETYLTFRQKAITTNFYRFGESSTSSKVLHLQRVGGTGGNLILGTSGHNAIKDGDVLRVDCKGSLIECYLNGDRVFEVVDADADLMANGDKIGFFTNGSATQQATFSHLTAIAL